MIGYATITGNARSRAAIENYGWRWFLTPFTQHSPGKTGYALDNGAWSAFQNDCEFDAAAFERAVERWGRGADFIVLPDIVAGGLESLAYSASWFDRLAGIAPLLLAVQDGMTSDDVKAASIDVAGVFVGGTTGWKLSSLPGWGTFCRREGAYLHVARVNTRKRIRLAHLSGAASFDGTSVSRFSKSILELDDERLQPTLGLFAAPTPVVKAPRSRTPSPTEV